MSVSCQHWSALVSTGQLVVAEERSSKGLHLSSRCQAEEAEEAEDYNDYNPSKVLLKGAENSSTS